MPELVTLEGDETLPVYTIELNGNLPDELCAQCSDVLQQLDPTLSGDDERDIYLHGYAELNGDGTYTAYLDGMDDSELGFAWLRGLSLKGLRLPGLKLPNIGKGIRFKMPARINVGKSLKGVTKSLKGVTSGIQKGLSSVSKNIGKAASGAAKAAGNLPKDALDALSNLTPNAQPAEEDYSNYQNEQPAEEDYSDYQDEQTAESEDEMNQDDYSDYQNEDEMQGDELGFSWSSLTPMATDFASKIGNKLIDKIGTKKSGSSSSSAFLSNLNVAMKKSGPVLRQQSAQPKSRAYTMPAEEPAADKQSKTTMIILAVVAVVIFFVMNKKH